MRHVDPPEGPDGWQTRVFEAGKGWLDESEKNRNAENAAPYWRAFGNEIGAAFDFICCYTVVYVPNGQADHFVPWAHFRGRDHARDFYQWANVRYADGWINASKGADRFPDPFQVQDDSSNWICLPWSCGQRANTHRSSKKPLTTCSNACGTTNGL